MTPARMHIDMCDSITFLISNIHASRCSHHSDLIAMISILERCRELSRQAAIGSLKGFDTYRLGRNCQGLIDHYEGSLVANHEIHFHLILEFARAAKVCISS